MHFEKLKLVPVGYVKTSDSETVIELLPDFTEAAEGLQEGDWIKLILWFHRSDTPGRRKVVKVHPHGDPESPIRGVFATRSPHRPNPVALYTVRIHDIEGSRLYVDRIDAIAGTPVIDIKIFAKRYDCPEETR